jgi:hypothetical protein
LAGFGVTYPIKNTRKTMLFLVVFFSEIDSNEKVKNLQITPQSRSPSLRSSGRNARLWDNPFQGGI